MNNANRFPGRAVFGALLPPRKRIAFYVLVLVLVAIASTTLHFASDCLRREDRMEQQLSIFKSHIRYLESQYKWRQEDVINIQTDGETNHIPSKVIQAALTPEVQTLLQDMSGSKAAAGMNPAVFPPIRSSFIFQLLPHLMNDPYSLKPAYHMSEGRNFVDFVIGVPTVKRDKENYLMITISHLVEGLTDNDLNSTLIVVMVGETDLEFVLETARDIEAHFPLAVDNGLIEVISPSLSYYPDLNALDATLGDSQKRFNWRTKQNLDAIFLMAYAKNKGTFFLMLEDDVVTRNKYMQDIKQFTAKMNLESPKWVIIDYCNVGGIGKLFRAADLPAYLAYMQLFYNNMPIDWLMESYLADRVCNLEKNTKTCIDAKENVRPRFKPALFQHIGLYSSLKGKIQKVKGVKNWQHEFRRLGLDRIIFDNNARIGPIPTFFPHTNPPLLNIRNDIPTYSDHTLQKAYEGKTYFWGLKPQQGNVLEFWFTQPINFDRFTIRSGNIDHPTDKFHDATVEVLPLNGNYTAVGNFDEFGLAEGEIDAGPVISIRVVVNRDSAYWIAISEIDFVASAIQPEER